LLIPARSARPSGAALAASPLTHMHYIRESDDQMTVSGLVEQSGYLRINEAWDPGWHAVVDGRPVSLIAGDDLFLTVPLEPGYHQVQLQFSTPGALTGFILSALSLVGLLVVTSNVWTARSGKGEPHVQK
jgi:uncharacterized membrane protein YfhO